MSRSVRPNTDTTNRNSAWRPSSFTGSTTDSLDTWTSSEACQCGSNRRMSGCGMNRYWLWDYASNTGTHALGLLPQEIVDLQMLGEVFDPAEFNPRPAQWFTPRNWA